MCEMVKLGPRLSSVIQVQPMNTALQYWSDVVLVLPNLATFRLGQFSNMNCIFATLEKSQSPKSTDSRLVQPENILSSVALASVSTLLNVTVFRWVKLRKR